MSLSQKKQQYLPACKSRTRFSSYDTTPSSVYMERAFNFFLNFESFICFNPSLTLKQLLRHCKVFLYSSTVLYIMRHYRITHRRI